MKLVIKNKDNLIKKFLEPITKITDKCVVNVNKDFIYSLTSNDDATIILYSVYKTVTDIKDSKLISLNVPDIKRLTRAFGCITENDLNLELNANNIEYSSDTLKFKYHLLDDGIIQKNVVSVDKIKALTFDCEFILSQDKLLDIVKGSSFAVDTNKLYFHTKDKNVYAELTDKNTQNTDSISYNVTNSYTGSEIKEAMPIKVDIFRSLLGLKEDIKIKINTKIKVLMFEIQQSDYVMKYIVSALVN
jgi:hypothetical protein